MCLCGNRDDTVRVLSAIRSRTGKLDEVMHVLLGLHHDALPDDRPGGLGELTADHSQQLASAMTGFQPHISSLTQTLSARLILDHLPDDNITACLNKLEVGRRCTR